MLSDIENLALNYRDPDKLDGVWFIQTIYCNLYYVTRIKNHGCFDIVNYKSAVQTLRKIMVSEINGLSQIVSTTRARKMNNITYKLRINNSDNNTMLMMSILPKFNKPHDVKDGFLKNIYFDL